MSSHGGRENYEKHAFTDPEMGSWRMKSWPSAEPAAAHTFQRNPIVSFAVPGHHKACSTSPFHIHRIQTIGCDPLTLFPQHVLKACFIQKVSKLFFFFLKSEIEKLIDLKDNAGVVYICVLWLQKLEYLSERCVFQSTTRCMDACKMFHGCFWRS